MKKSLIALAVAGAFAAPAFAASSNVDISGELHLSLDYLDADTAAQSGNWNVSSNASYIQFAGSEDLGGGMKAVWKLKQYFDVGGTGASADGSFGATANGFSAGPTYVGLSGGFGTVILGKEEAPLKIVSRKVELFGNKLGDSRNLLVADGAATDIRPNNVIAYATPTMNGFNASIAYVTNTAAGAANDNSTTAVSANAFYTNGGLLLGAGYQNRDITGAPDETIWRLAGGYSFGDFKVVAIYQDTSDAGGVANADRNVWGLGGAYKMGPMTLKAQYYSADDRKNTSNTGADMWALGLDYSMSKRTSAYVAYASTDNDSGAKFSAFGGGHGDKPTVANGGNPHGISLGLIHKF